MTAYIYLRPDPHYRIEAFAEGARRLGHHVEYDQPHQVMQPDDIAIIWNRSSRSRQTLDMAKKGNAAVIVAENGYYGKDADGWQTYALALDGHNGSGRWVHTEDDTRLKALNIPFEPMRSRTSRRVVVAAQRGIGMAPMASPTDFGFNMVKGLRNQGWDAIERAHPGRRQPERTLDEDLENAHALVVWSSNCATRALIKGVPTFYRAPHIVTSGGAKRLPLGLSLEHFCNDNERHRAFVRMSWAQWFLSEIESGEPLKLLADLHLRSVDASS